jgi:DNA-directed RNA polymerase subunit RPC12/RpoP
MKKTIETRVLKIPFSERTTEARQIITDEGNGGYYCVHCEVDLGLEPPSYENCPQCGYKITNK